MGRHEGKILKCPICDRIIATAAKWDLNMHMKKIHNSTQCGSCFEVLLIENSKTHICHK